MSNILITGANRGLGLEFVRQYAKENNNIIACCRKPEQAENLNNLSKELNNIKICKLDVNNEQDINDLVKSNNSINIDILINCAGIYGSRGKLDDVTKDDLMSVFQTNTVAPLMISRALINNIKNSDLKTIVNISSKMGSIASNNDGIPYAYRASKTALNMVMKSLAIDLKSDNIKIMVLHPGWVQTDMGGPSALVTVEQSISGMRNVIAKNPSNDILPFYNYNGEIIPW